MKPKILSRVIVPHVGTCFNSGKQHEWSGIIKGSFFGDYRANAKGKSPHHFWYKVSCNNPKCEAIKAVHSSVLENA